MEPNFAELLSKPVLTVQQTAEILGLNHKTVREAIENGSLTVIRLGRTIRIPTSAVRAMLGI